MSLVQGVEAELRFVDRALERELAEWRDLGENDDVFKVHRSQIARICRTLQSTRQALGIEADALAGAPADALLGGLQERRKRLQALHLVWNFFRDKLLQRLRPEFQRFLLAADDLAWTCYRPFLERVQGEKDGLREPPLTFLSLDSAPFAQARDSSFAPQGLSSRELGRLYQILRMLPVPIIGLPWLQAGHFPDLCLVGHETAHIVADDLGLERSLPDLIAGVDAIDEARRPLWQKWMDETFADIMGVLACGAGYGHALTRALADDVGRVRTETPDVKGAYPPRDIRVRVVAATALRADVPAEFADAWHETYALPESELSGDVAPLVETVLEHRFERLGGARLQDVLAPPNVRRVAEYVDAAVEGSVLPGPGRFDIRCAIAAAAIAYVRDRDANPRDMNAQPYDLLARHIQENREDGYRDAAGVNKSARLHEEDASIGRDIAALLR